MNPIQPIFRQASIELDIILAQQEFFWNFLNINKKENINEMLKDSFVNAQNKEGDSLLFFLLKKSLKQTNDQPKLLSETWSEALGVVYFKTVDKTIWQKIFESRHWLFATSLLRGINSKNSEIQDKKLFIELFTQAFAGLALTTDEASYILEITTHIYNWPNQTKQQAQKNVLAIFTRLKNNLQKFRLPHSLLQDSSALKDCINELKKRYPFLSSTSNLSIPSSTNNNNSNGANQLIKIPNPTDELINIKQSFFFKELKEMKKDCFESLEKKLDNEEFLITRNDKGKVLLIFILEEIQLDQGKNTLKFLDIDQGRRFLFFLYQKTEQAARKKERRFGQRFFKL